MSNISARSADKNSCSLFFFGVKQKLGLVSVYIYLFLCRCEAPKIWISFSGIFNYFIYLLKHTLSIEVSRSRREAPKKIVKFRFIFFKKKIDLYFRGWLILLYILGTKCEWFNLFFGVKRRKFELVFGDVWLLHVFFCTCVASKKFYFIFLKI